MEGIGEGWFGDKAAKPPLPKLKSPISRHSEGSPKIIGHNELMTKRCRNEFGMTY